MNINVKDALAELDRVTAERLARENKTALMKKIDGLPELDRSVFLLRAQKRSYIEIAHHLRRPLLDIKCAMWDAVAALSANAQAGSEKN
ncbi:MAG: hypothetical protein AABZ39_07685 [Spirochaetota bacterium]